MLGDQGLNHFTGRVEHLVYRGQLLTLTVRVGERTIVADLPTHAGKLPALGETVSLSIAPDDVTLIGEAAS